MGSQDAVKISRSQREDSYRVGKVDGRAGRGKEEVAEEVNSRI